MDHARNCYSFSSHYTMFLTQYQYDPDPAYVKLTAHDIHFFKPLA